MLNRKTGAGEITLQNPFIRPNCNVGFERQPTFRNITEQTTVKIVIALVKILIKLHFTVKDMPLEHFLRYLIINQPKVSITSSAVITKPLKTIFDQ
jgi:hypothetical protein